MTTIIINSHYYDYYYKNSHNYDYYFRHALPTNIVVQLLSSYYSTYSSSYLVASSAWYISISYCLKVNLKY